MYLSLIKNWLEKQIFEEEQFEVEKEELAPWKMIEIDEETNEPRIAKDCFQKF